MRKFIHWIYDNKSFIKDGIIYNTTDGCNKKYRCANTTWLLYVLKFTHIVIIYRCINATGHGRSIMNGSIVDYKTYLKKCT